MSNPEVSDNIALATVTTADFLPGTLVTLDSFLRTNPWFSGTIVIIHENLDSRMQDLLSQKFEDLVFHEVSNDLRIRLNKVENLVPWIGKKRAEFASLELLALTKFQRVVFCDSDLLFKNSISDLLSHSDDLVCCGDGTNYRGNARSRNDFSEVSKSEANSGLLKNTFNSGLMVFGPGLLTEKNFEAAISLVVPERWQHDTSGHTDQMIFNLCFDGQQKIVSAKYNYALAHRELIKQATGLSLQDASVIHFNGKAKPWIPDFSIMQGLTDNSLRKVYFEWNRAYSEIGT